MTRVLVVDDNPLNVNLARAMLERSGFSVETASSGPAALARLAEQSFDTVITDIGMPEMSGIDLCHAVRASVRPTPRLVAFTSFALEAQRAAVMAAGFDAIVIKPASKAVLAAAAAVPHTSSTL